MKVACSGSLGFSFNNQQSKFNNSPWLRGSVGKSSCRLLLGHAVHGAEAPYEISAVDGDDLAGGEDLGESVESNAVIGVVEYWNENSPVRDIEIGVACGQAATLENYRARHGEFDDLKLLAVLIGSCAEAAEVFGEGRMVGIGSVGFHHGDDCARGNEAGDVIDMAVSVVASDALTEPDDFLNAEVVRENLLVVLPVETGIAFLDFAEKAFFCGEESTLSVDVDGTTFKHYTMFVS